MLLCSKSYRKQCPLDAGPVEVLEKPHFSQPLTTSRRSDWLSVTSPDHPNQCPAQMSPFTGSRAQVSESKAPLSQSSLGRERDGFCDKSAGDGRKPVGGEAEETTQSRASRLCRGEAETQAEEGSAGPHRMRRRGRGSHLHGKRPEHA